MERIAFYVVTAVSPGQVEPKLGLYGEIASVNENSAVQWHLLALDKATGKVLWDTLGARSDPAGETAQSRRLHANSTPATDGEHIVALLGSEGLFCFSREGKLLWKKDLGPMVSAYYLSPTAQRGFASSPVIHDGKVVVLCDVISDSFLAVFDLADGRELWRAKRDDVPTWGSPNVVESGGRKLVLVNGWKHSGAYDFATGAGGLEAQWGWRHPGADADRGRWRRLLHQRPWPLSADARDQARREG